MDSIKIDGMIKKREDTIMSRNMEDDSNNTIAEMFVNKSIVFKQKMAVTRTKAMEVGSPLSRTISVQKKESAESEFRNVTVLFCKLGFSFDEIKSQAALVGFLNAVDANGGIFQQFSGIYIT